MTQNRLQILVLMSLLSTLLLSESTFAQAEKPSSAPGNTATAKVDDRRLPSATALGDIFFRSRNSLIFSLGVQESATDNLYFSPAASLTGVPDSGRSGYIPFTTLSGRMAYQRQLQRTTFGLDYGVSGILFRSRDSGDFVSHDGGIDLSYRVTPRATFSIGDRISVSPAPGRFYRHDLVLNAVSPQVVPNSTLFIGLNRTITNTAFTSFSYEVSRRSQITLGANGAITRFQQRDLSEMNQSGGQLAYSYQVAERTAVSLGYQFSYYDFSPPRTQNVSVAYSGIARSHLAYVGITHQLTPSIGAFIQAGPSYIVGNSLGFFGGPGRRPGIRTSVNGGLTFGEAISLDPRTFFSIHAGQNISDGYGLGGITQTQSAGVSLGRRLTKVLTGSVHGSYSRNQFLLNLDANGKPVTTNGISSGVNLSLNATERFNIFANYVYFRQLSSGFSTLIPDRADGNTFTVGLNYSFPVFF
ncbi:MAG: hypothetical protein L0387_08740 [Acidobacteria bacterium]|nr:hypothetical protein [Acidobacteriota bacterium]MCI0718370.1 hypothetical protein [Acidobacteriota bacterium]